MAPTKAAGPASRKLETPAAGQESWALATQTDAGGCATVTRMRSLALSIPLGRPVAILVLVAALFLTAWVLSKVAERVAAVLVDRTERRRRGGPSAFDTGMISSLRQRETAIALIATSVRYLVFAIAVALSLVALSGMHRIQTIVGASFLAVIVGFAVQRFLTDVVAGLLMFFDGWFRIGDTVSIDAWRAEGVVEKVSLRALTLRTIKGEIVHIPNSQVTSLRVIPRGYREVEVEFFVTDLERGRQVLEGVARIVPVGPTRFLRRPEVVEAETLDADLHRITVRCAVAVGREWLAEDFLPQLIKERSAEELLVHGPIVTFIDEGAARSFARANGKAQPLHPADAASPVVAVRSRYRSFGVGRARTRRSRA
jgi:small-conductance mechanosensitive channel